MPPFFAIALQCILIVVLPPCLTLVADVLRSLILRDDKRHLVALAPSDNYLGEP